MRLHKFMIIGWVVCASAIAGQSHAGPFEDFDAAQVIIRKMTIAYGGADAIGSLNSLSFETDSTYFAFHQSMDINDDWDAQEQFRHYAIDLVRGNAAFGRDMEEWSFHDKYMPEHTFHVDNERRVYTTSAGASMGSYAHVFHMVPSLMVKHLLASPYDARHYGHTGSKAEPFDEIYFIDQRGRGATLYVDATTHLIARLKFVSHIEPFGDMQRTIYYEDYADAEGVMTPMTIRTGVGDEIEFEHRLKNIRINGAIDTYLSIPEDYKEIPGTPRHEWRLEKIADAVHLATNGTYNIPIIEFADHVISYNASRSYEDIYGVIDAVAAAFPDKPLKYALFSHHHFDRAGSAGAYAERGVTLMAARKYEDRIRSFIENRKIVRASEVTPLSVATEFVPVEDKQVIKDSLQHMQIFNVKGNSEAETVFVAYLSNSKILIHEGDLFRKYRHGPLRMQRRGSVALEAFIVESGLDVETLLGNRGSRASIDDLRQTNLQQRFRQR